MNKIEKVIVFFLGGLLLLSTSIGFFKLLNRNGSEYISGVITEYEISTGYFKSDLYKLLLTDSIVSESQLTESIKKQKNNLQKLKDILSNDMFLSKNGVNVQYKNYISASSDTVTKTMMWKDEFKRIRDVSENTLSTIENCFITQHNAYRQLQIYIHEAQDKISVINIIISGCIIIASWLLGLFLSYNFAKNQFIYKLDEISSKQRPKLKLYSRAKYESAKKAPSSMDPKLGSSLYNFKSFGDDPGSSVVSNYTKLDSVSSSSTIIYGKQSGINNTENHSNVDSINHNGASNQGVFVNSDAFMSENRSGEISRLGDDVTQCDSQSCIKHKSKYDEFNSYDDNNHSDVGLSTKVMLTDNLSENISEKNVENLQREFAVLQNAHDELQQINIELTKEYDRLKSEYESESSEVKKEAREVLIREIHETVEKTTDDAIEAQQLMADFNESSKLFKTTHDRIVYTTKSVMQITEIGEMMETIADQIKMLSMNAAIEAAHAGNAGKGFAVVAEEMGRLAVASSDNSKDITTTVKEIVKDITFIAQSGGDLEKAFEKLHIQTDKVYNSVQIFSKKIKDDYDEYQNILNS